MHDLLQAFFPLQEDCKNHLTHRAVPEDITVVIGTVDEEMM
jgi:hypothetical protein